MIRNPFLRSSFRLPLGRHSPALVLALVLGLMAYLGSCTGLGLIAIGDGLRGREASSAGAVTLQVPADASAARLSTVLALLRQTRGIVGVRLLEPAETARLVEPWLGPSIAIDRLPVPRLIDVRVDGDAAADLVDLRQKLAAILPDARLEQHGLPGADFRSAALRLTGVLIAFFAVVLMVAIFSAGWTARSAARLDRGAIELLHMLGAADNYIARPFQAQALRLGLLGGGAGALAAALTMVALGDAGPALHLPPSITADQLADWRVWLILIGAAIAAGGIAMAAARLAVMRQLARMP